MLPRIPFKSKAKRVSKLVVAIRREDPKRIWERRAPLTPDDVNYLLSKYPIDVLVAPCHRRVFPEKEYEKAGAHISTDLSNAHIVLGIKEVPLAELALPDTTSTKSRKLSPPQLASALANSPTHLMFSHTHKGQAYNVPLLSRFVAHQDTPQHLKALYPRLIDYEMLMDSNGKRTVGFGWHAGVAGVLESLSSMAHAHLELGIASPFLYTPRPHTLPSVADGRAQLRNIGKIISIHGTPPALGPFIIGLTGHGKVAEGCLSMLSELPIQEVKVHELDHLVRNPDTDLHKVYLVHVKPEDYLVGLDGRKYDRNHYYSSPQSYSSVFHDKIAPYLTLFLNGTGWGPTFPRLMTNDQLAGALERARHIGGARFTNIGDISCDVEGGLEFLTKATTLSDPFYKTRPPTLPAEYPSVQMMSVDILPASIPFDASNHFSRTLRPYVESLIKYHTESDKDQYTGALDRATIAAKGDLAEPHKWLQNSVNKFYSALPKPTNKKDQDETEATQASIDVKQPSLRPNTAKRILMLGSGMVAKPAVDTIAKHAGAELVIASNSLLELQTLASPHLNVKYRIIDVANVSTYQHLIEEADVVISLLPVHFHPSIAELCIKLRKHLVTASYISQDMAKLDQSAREADVLLLNEIGLDPGIDHCSAIELISRLQSQRKQIVSFTSFCGGLPAPEDSYVPLRYKFSWRPQGVLTATMNPALFQLHNRVESVRGSSLLKSSFPDVPITTQFPLEGIPNRDSLKYRETYNLASPSLRTIIRGTLRYPGFSSLMNSFIELGLLEQSSTIYLERWSDLVKKALSVRYPALDGTIPALRDIIAVEDLLQLTEALQWLGLIAPTPMVLQAPTGPMPALPSEPMTPLDIFAYLLSYKLRYGPNERDMVVLSHEVIVREPGHAETVHTSSLITFGDQHASAMSRTVGIPVAIAALNVAEGKIGLRGVAGPTDASIYEPVLRGLEERGFGMKETTRTTTPRKAPAPLSRKTIEQAILESQRARSGGAPQSKPLAETPEQVKDLETEWKL